MKNIWQDLPTPFFCLAPMQNVTNTVFRQRIAALGKPDLMFTEFVPVEGLLSPGHRRVKESLAFDPLEQPVIAQIWGTNLDLFPKTAALVADLGFAGVDLNFGCPDKAVVRKGACSAMIKTPDKAVEIIQATIKGTEGRIPVSVKTRLGFDKMVTREWSQILLEQDIAALTMHARTTEELSKVPAHWEEFEKIVSLRDEMGKDIKIVGNGDILTREQGKQLAREYKLDGVMIARGVFHNPWLFNPQVDIEELSPREKKEALALHIDAFVERYGNKKGYERMKKLVKMYISGFRGAGKLKKALLLSASFEEFSQLVYQHRNPDLN